VSPVEEFIIFGCHPMIFFFWFATSDLKAGKVMSNKNIIIKWQIICAHDNGHPLLKQRE